MKEEGPPFWVRQNLIRLLHSWKLNLKNYIIMESLWWHILWLLFLKTIKIYRLLPLILMLSIIGNIPTSPISLKTPILISGKNSAFQAWPRISCYQSSLIIILQTTNFPTWKLSTFAKNKTRMWQPNLAKSLDKFSMIFNRKSWFNSLFTAKNWCSRILVSFIFLFLFLNLFFVL